MAAYLAAIATAASLAAAAPPPVENAPDDNAAAGISLGRAGPGSEIPDDLTGLAAGPLPPLQPPAPPQLGPRIVGSLAGAVILDGDGQTRTVDCAGRAVLIHGDGGQFRLTHGCRAISVQGRGNRINAEVEPGARISIGGADVMLIFAVVTPGPPPVLSVTATNSRAIEVERIDGAPPAGAASPR